MTHQWPNEIVEVYKVFLRWFDPIHDYRSKPVSEWEKNVIEGMKVFIKAGSSGNLAQWLGAAGGPAAFVVVMFHAATKLECPFLDKCIELATKCARDCVNGSNSLQKLNGSIPPEMRSVVMADFLAPLRHSSSVMDLNVALKAARTLRLPDLVKELEKDFKSLEQTQTMSMSISEPEAQQPSQPMPVFDAMQVHSPPRMDEFGVHNAVSAPPGLTPVDDSPHVPTQQNHTPKEESSLPIMQWDQNSGEITAGHKSQDTIETKADDKSQTKMKSENKNNTMEEGESRNKKKKSKHKQITGPDHDPRPPARYIPGAGSITQKQPKQHQPKKSGMEGKGRVEMQLDDVPVNHRRDEATNSRRERSHSGSRKDRSDSRRSGDRNRSGDRGQRGVDRGQPRAKGQGHPGQKNQPKKEHVRDPNYKRDYDWFIKGDRKSIIKEVKGDLFESDDSLAHCVSEDFAMGAGIAVEFKNRFPKMRDMCFNMWVYTGGVAPYKDNSSNPSRWIYNLVTKKVYNNKPIQESVNKSLEAMRDHAVKHGVKAISMPMIGCGLDQLRWDIMSDNIDRIFADSGISITVYYL